ncbi:MAG TPA: tRNA (N(6)-L-threonylcarbamoyladenosine(37)-C(2))-methylthiotransferase MtaB [Proteobacteria bacterium]|nr:tRNA (N(6)-L-threonylcarbamoyladenosine(37)-C(2))-methylthiotransferase MtaB [Pseudomonadota bacterium]
MSAMPQSEKPRVLIKTLGCKVNHYESLALAEEFRRQGWQVEEQGPFAAVVVNGCAVTAEAGRQSLQCLRRVRKLYPEACLVLTGCAAMAESEKALQVENLGALVGNPGKVSLVSWLTTPRVSSGVPAVFGLSGELGIESLRNLEVTGRTRAEVKIQDGCNAFCRYCIIPYLRGRCRSLPPAAVLAECRRLAEAGFQEIVLTGIHIGRYGDDLAEPITLTSLLDFLVQALPEPRLRLGSLQPHEITPRLIELLLDPQTPLCEHLHLSLQAVSDRVLGAMGRPYRLTAITELFSRLQVGGARLAIGTDLIVGFPAETAAAFQETLAFIENSDLAYLHVFPYSARPETVAGAWPDRVPAAEKKARAAVLGALGRAKRNHFAETNLGCELEVLLESRIEHAAYGPAWFGHSRNYLPVLVRESAQTAGYQESRRVKVTANFWDGHYLSV